jgi:hypothetical protein
MAARAKADGKTVAFPPFSDIANVRFVQAPSAGGADFSSPVKRGWWLGAQRRDGGGVVRRLTPPPSRCVFASRHLPRFAGEEKN